MIKSKKFILIAILTLIVLFAASAVCNLCGIRYENTDGTDISDETSTESRENGNSSGTNEDTPDVTEEPLQTEETDEGQPANHEPEIIRVEANSEEIDIDEEFRIMSGTDINFQVTANDEDGDTLSYFASDSNGNNYETAKLDNENAAFGFITPDALGHYEIYIKVIDDKGAETGETIQVTVGVLAEPFEEEPETATINIGLYGPLCASISATANLISANPWVIAGDGFSNQQIKCYLSFDITPLTALGDIEITNATLDLGRLTHINDPTFAERLDIKAFDYGEPGIEDFAVGGTALISCSTSLYEFSFSNASLVSTIQSAVDEGKDYYQLKLGLSSATDGDGINDVLRINFDEALLSITYEE